MNYFYSRFSFFSAKKFFVFVLFVTLSWVEVSFAQPQEYWTQIDSLPAIAAPRERAVGMAIGNYGYIGTGFDGTTYFKGWWRYDPGNNSWTQMADLGLPSFPSIAGRERTVGFSLGGYGYVGTGSDGGTNYNSWWQYDPAANTWALKANFGGAARFSAAGFAIGAFGYVGSGYNGSTYYNDLWRYNPALDSWTQMANVPSPARYSAVGFSIGSYGYLGTGYSGSALSDFWQYDPGTNTWMAKANIPGGGRAVAVGFSIGAKGYVGTGYTGASNTHKNDWYEYDPAANTWTTRVPFAGNARYGAVGFSINGAGYIGTGYDNSNSVTKDFWKYVFCNTAIASTNVNCFGSCDGSAIAGTSGGAMPYTYVWSNGATTSSVSNLCVGGYTVTVTDGNSCVSADSVFITEPPPLLANMVKHNDTICFGKSTTIGANPSGGSPGPGYSYTWSPPAGLSCTACANTTATPTSTTIYTFTVTDINGCTAKDSVEIVVIPLPTVFAGPDDTICSGQSAALNATGNSVSYVWSPATGLSNPNISNPVATPSFTTTYSVTGTNANGCSNTDMVKVNVVSSPTVNVSLSTTTVCSGATVFLNSSSNATSFSWSPSVGLSCSTCLSPSASATVTTSYTLTVTSANGCTKSDSVNIFTNPRPFPTFVTNEPSCFGMCDGQSTATPSAGTSPFTYSWITSPTQTTQTATGLCDTIYTVYVVDAKGCSASGTVTVTEPTVLDMTLTPTSAGCICNGTVSSTPQGGTPPYNYLWSTTPVQQTTSTATGLCAGNYSVTVTDVNGCSDTHSDSVSQSPPVVVSVSQSTTICSGDGTTLSASVSGSASISYNWFPGNFTTDTISVSPTINTTYTVIASDNSTGCSDTDFVFVAVVQTPIVSITGNDTICSGGTTLLTGSGSGIYLWSTNQTTTSISVAPSVSTIYSLTVTATSGNTSCADVDSFSVAVISSPVISVYQKYDTICFGLSFDTLIASGGSSYTWVPGPQTGDTIVVSPDITTTYTVYVSNSNGCTGISTVTVAVQGGFLPPVVTGIFSYCDGDSILPVNVTPPTLPPAIVVWFDSTSTQIAAGNIFFPPQNLSVGATSYLAIQGTSDQCVSNPTVVTFTINPLPIADAGNNITICSGHTAQLNATGGTTYLWSPSTYLNQANIFNPSSNPDSTFSYEVLVSDGNNCRDRDSVTVYIAVNDTCRIHIYNVLSPNGDGDNDTWWIDGINLFPDNFVEIFNRWGNSVWHAKHYDNKRVFWRGQNDAGQPLPAGTYYYVIDIKDLGRFSKWVELLR